MIYELVSTSLLSMSALCCKCIRCSPLTPELMLILLIPYSPWWWWCWWWQGLSKTLDMIRVTGSTYTILT